MKTCVHVCGFNVNGENWANLIIGEPKHGRLGRASAALDIAVSENADLLSFGTGASHTADGRSEAAYTRDMLLENLDKMGYGPKQYGHARGLLVKARIDGDREKTKNTADEIRNVLKYCVLEGFDKLIAISDGTHATRVRNLLSQIKREIGIRNAQLLTGVYDADSDFGGGPKNNVCFEPPVNPHDPRLTFPEQYQTHVVLPQLFKLFGRPEKLHAALVDIADVIRRHAS